MSDERAAETPSDFSISLAAHSADMPAGEPAPYRHRDLEGYSPETLSAILDP
jgi:hypothetical protein